MTIYLERGCRGIVSCPPITFGQVPLEETDAVYWYLRQVGRGSLLISYFRGTVAPQNGNQEGVYDINSNFSLVIENVKDSDEGIYFCKVKPRLKLVEDGHVSVAVKVSPKGPFPNVSECSQPTSESTCEALLRHDIVTPRLTCVVRNVKPPVAVRWLVVYSNGDKELISDKFTVQNEILAENIKNEDLSWLGMHNTFTTSSSIALSSCNVHEAKYRCEAYGDALGDRNGSHVTVTIITAPVTEDTKHMPLDTASVTTKTFGVKPTSDDTPCDRFISLKVAAAISILVNCIAFAACVRKLKPELMSDAYAISPVEMSSVTETSDFGHLLRNSPSSSWS